MAKAAPPIKRKAFPESVWRQIFDRCEGRCVDCDTPHRYEDSGKTYHFDHCLPLWLATPKLRARWDKPHNIEVRCIEPCHAAKTKREAGQRAKMKRLIAKAVAHDAAMRKKRPGKAPPKEKSRFPAGRKLQSRPFSKTHRPLRPLGHAHAEDRRD